MTTWANYDDIVAQLVAAGFDVSMPEVGAMKRAKVEGCAQKGWYSLHEITLDSGETALIGAYGWWKGAEKFQHNFELRIDSEKRKLNAEQIAAFKKRMADEAKKARARREADARRAADEAQRVWARYLPDGTSGYLERKGVKAHGLRFAPGADTCAVPMFDTRGSLWGLQILRGKDRGDKLEKQYFPKGVEVREHFHLLGKPGPIILLGEGYATAATLFEATGLPVAVAFDCGNLAPVAEALHRAHKHAKLLICADDDYHTEGNPGIKKAEVAALAVAGAVIVPHFLDANGVDLRHGKKLTDFNDLAALVSPVAVAAQIHSRIAGLGWNATPANGAPPPSGRDASPMGGGEREQLDAMVKLEDAAHRFALIYGGKGTLFDFDEHALIPKSDVLDILPPRAWDQLKTHPFWRAYRLSEVGFDPAGNDRAIKCNLYGGWPTVPKKGNCQALLDLLEYLCIGEKNARETYKWVLRWLAYPIQHPGAKMKTALIFHGPQGVGKNLFFEAVMAIYGDYGRIIDQAAIEDKFNDWASRKLFLIADEVVARQELYHVKNKLKHFVTGDWIRINPKNVAAHEERNHVNIVYLSNELQPLPLDPDDRRHLVIWTPEKSPAEFYAAVRDEINAGGIAALHHHLLHLDLGDFDEHTKPPMTEAKQSLIERSLAPQIAFVEDWKTGQAYLGHGQDDAPLPFCPALGSDLYDAYQRWCKKNGIQYPGDISKFIGTLAKLPGWQAGKSVPTFDNLVQRNKKNRKMVLPSIDDITAAMASASVKTLAMDGRTQSEWATEGFFMFSAALPARS